MNAASWFLGALAFVLACTVVIGLVSGQHDVTLGPPILRDTNPATFWGCFVFLTLLALGMGWLAFGALLR